MPALPELPPPPAGKTGWPWTVESPPLPPTLPGGLPWPSFSIITPSYNQADYLEETLRSVLLQGYPAVELIVIDGGSTDASPEILARYAPWLTYWVSEPDQGQSHAINKGWSRATGDLIAYLNSDDFYLPGALLAVAAAWQGDPSVAVIVGGIRFTDEHTRPLSERPPFLRLQPLSDPPGQESSQRTLAAPNRLAYSPFDLSLLPPLAWYLPQQSSFFARTHLDASGRCLRQDLHYTMDRELMYRLCRQGKTLLLPGEILAGDRHHAASKRLSQSLKMYNEDARALEYCTWGDQNDARQRRRVACWRRAQGHYHYAQRAPTLLSAAYHFGVAAWYRPAYLKSRGYFKSLRKRFARS